MTGSDPTATPGPAPLPRRRRRWALSVRGLMLLVLLVGGLIGWEAHRVDRFRRAIATLERAVEAPGGEGSDVRFRSPLSRPSSNPNSQVRVVFAEPRGWSDVAAVRWLRRWIGDDHFDSVVGLYFGRRPTAEDWEAIEALGTVRELSIDAEGMTDADLEPLARVATLRDLRLSGGLKGNHLTGRVLVAIGQLTGLRKLRFDGARSALASTATPLAGLRHLEELDIGSISGTDDVLAQLRQFDRLRSLELGPVGDAGLAQFVALPQLESFAFEPWCLTDAGLASLAQFPKLRRLRIKSSFGLLIARLTDDRPWAMAITAAGLEALGRMRRLEDLEFGDYHEVIDDAWLAAIGRLGALRTLQIGGDRITDAGLAPLGNLPGLETLSLIAPAVTDAGVKHLARMTRLTELRLTAPVDVLAATARLRAALPHLKGATIQRPADLAAEFEADFKAFQQETGKAAP